jgi:RHS repeat-associated protein
LLGLSKLSGILNIDINGKVVVKYYYDAWGNAITEVLDQTAYTIANLNPFRYRSYYYDTETELYYLKSRYYDPKTCRFITIDDVSYLDPDSVNGLNLYAYCANNPVMHTDPS